MASSSSRKLGKNVSFRGTTSLEKEMETLTISKRLIRNLSEKMKNKKTSKCLNVYMKGGGCSRVSACEEIDISGTVRHSVSEDCLPLRGGEKKSSRKPKPADLCPSLPEDMLELILARLPLSSLVAARLVCKKWSNLITTPHFMRLRVDGFHQTPWLFLFNVSRRDGFHVGEVHALDVVGDQWHRISVKKLIGRFSFSVASIDRNVYIVGGCFSDPVERGTFRASNEVLVFSPLTGSCHEVCPMRTSRSGAALGAFEVSSVCSIFRSQSKRQNQGQVRFKARIGGVSDVYEDPHRFSLRRQFRDAFKENGSDKPEPSNSAEQGRNNRPNITLIAVGGRGSRDEPLDSGEVYDPITNNWIEIPRLPRDFGATGSGAVCKGMFYVYSEAGKLAGFDLDRGFWILIQTILPPSLREFSPKLVSCINRLFISCVCWSEREGPVNTREKAVRVIWEFDTATSSWAEVSRHPDAPMDCNAAFVADKDRIYGFEMFSIFGQVLDFVTACHVAADARMRWSRISKKHGGHAADTSSGAMKSMVVLNV